MRLNPVVIAVFAAVHDIGEDFSPVLNMFPKQVKDAAGHFWMSDNTVRLPKALLLCVSGNAQEHVIAVGDAPLEIRLADNNLIFFEDLSTPVTITSLAIPGSNVSLRISSASQPEFVSGIIAH